MKPVFLLPILMLAAGILELTLQYRWHDRRTRIHKRVRAALVAVLLLGGIVSTVAVIQEERQARQEIDRLEDVVAVAEESEAAAEAREQAAVSARASLEERLRELQVELQPFLDLATRRHPGQPQDEALGALLAELQDVRSRLDEVAEATGAGEIRQLEIEARLTCSLAPGAELPPDTVDFVPVGDSHAYLERSGSRVRLSFVSPVVFRRTPRGITVINTFALGSSGPLASQPREVLQSFSMLSVPIVTVVHGRALAQILLLEVSLRINGETSWYESWEYDVPFEQGPRFSVPLDGLHARLAE